MVLLCLLNTILKVGCPYGICEFDCANTKHTISEVSVAAAKTKQLYLTAIPQRILSQWQRQIVNFLPDFSVYHSLSQVSRDAVAERAC